MSIFEAIIQGIVQGATEFLPVSSSGHLSLAQHIMGVKVDSLLFDILLHLGTLIAVMQWALARSEKKAAEKNEKEGN